MARIITTEPHPTILHNTYTHSGRGGAGNHFRAPVTTPSYGVPTYTPARPTTVATSTSEPSRRFYSGRGGAGNARASVQRPTLSFDEECARAEARSQRIMAGHVGRGGAGNTWGASAPSFSFPSMMQRKDSDASSTSTSSGRSRRDSASTEESVQASGFMARLHLGKKR